jgi:hypothetical protein
MILKDPLIHYTSLLSLQEDAIENKFEPSSRLDKSKLDKSKLETNISQVKSKSLDKSQEPGKSKTSKNKQTEKTKTMKSQDKEKLIDIKNNEEEKLISNKGPSNVSVTDRSNLNLLELSINPNSKSGLDIISIDKHKEEKSLIHEPSLDLSDRAESKILIEKKKSTPAKKRAWDNDYK